MALNDLTPADRIESILDGGNVTPATRLEYFLQQAASEVPKPDGVSDAGKVPTVNAAGSAYELATPSGGGGASIIEQKAVDVSADGGGTYSINTVFKCFINDPNSSQDTDQMDALVLSDSDYADLDNAVPAFIAANIEYLGKTPYGVTVFDPPFTLNPAAAEHAGFKYVTPKTSISGKYILIYFNGMSNRRAVVVKASDMEYYNIDT